MGGAEAGGQVRSGFSARGWQHRGVGYTVRHASHDHIHPSALLQVDSVPSRVLLTRLLILLCVRDAVLDLAGERGAAQGWGQKFEALKNVEQGGAYSHYSNIAFMYSSSMTACVALHTTHYRHSRQCRRSACGTRCGKASVECAVRRKALTT